MSYKSRYCIHSVEIQSVFTLTIKNFNDSNQLGIENDQLYCSSIHIHLFAMNFELKLRPKFKPNGLLFNSLKKGNFENIK